jgi:hypothetical protein
MTTMAMLLCEVSYSCFYACWIVVYGEYFTLVDLLCVIFTSLRTFMFSLIKIHWKPLCSRKDSFFNFCKQGANFVIGFTIGCTKIN